MTSEAALSPPQIAGSDRTARQLPQVGAPGPRSAVPDAAMYRLMIENTVDMIICYDASSRRVYVSPASREILGYEPAELLGNEAQMMIHPEDLPKAEANFCEIGPRDPSRQIVFRVRHKNGAYVWVEGRYRYLPDDDGVIAVIRDINARKQAEQMLAESNAKLIAANQILRELACRDGLTGLINRRRFDELIEEECRRACRMARPLGIVMLDVDSFKSYNDTYGHLAGDDCLRRVSAAVMSVIRGPGDHAARFGGEEIAVLLPNTDLAGTTAIAERIRAAVSVLDIEHLSSTCGHVTVSAGTSASIPLHDNAASTLIGAADRALYRAKVDGRNQVREGRRDLIMLAS